LLLEIIDWNRFCFAVEAPICSFDGTRV